MTRNRTHAGSPKAREQVRIDRDEIRNSMKPVIYYHRALRMIGMRRKRFVVEISICALALILPVLCFYPRITALACRLAYGVLPVVPDQAMTEMRLVEAPFLTGPVFVLDGPGTYPSLELSFAVFLISAAALFLLPQIKISRPLAIWLAVAAFINLVSGAVFVFWPSSFPYDIKTFSLLYMKMEIGIWLFIPVVMGVAFVPLPSSFLYKLSSLLMILLYAMGLSVVRYALFISVLTRYSYVFMALLFFILGPFIDFALIVGIYSYFVSRISVKIQKDLRIWRWSY